MCLKYCGGLRALSWQSLQFIGNQAVRFNMSISSTNAQLLWRMALIKETKQCIALIYKTTNMRTKQGSVASSVIVPHGLKLQAVSVQAHGDRVHFRLRLLARFAACCTMDRFCMHEEARMKFRCHSSGQSLNAPQQRTYCTESRAAQGDQLAECALSRRTLVDGGGLASSSACDGMKPAWTPAHKSALGATHCCFLTFASA